MQDVIIIGGGVIGLSLALELARQGVAVTVLDQGQLGQEASWAGAGILPPGNPQFARTPEACLRAASHTLWPGLSERLLDETGIDNGFRRCGGLEVRLDGKSGDLDTELNAWREEGVEVECLTGGRPFSCEPEISPLVVAAYRLPGMAQVRNPRHLKALIASCAAHGVTLRPGTPALGFDRGHGFDRGPAKIVGVRTPEGTLPAGQFVVTSGAWSSRVLAEAGCRLDVRPMRGQMVLLSVQPSPIRQVINVGPRYLVPRTDGRILVGSTEEPVGFDKRNTAAGVGGLMKFAVELVPALEGATFERAWAGFRPQSRDGLPYLGLVPETGNLFVATGHFRAGLQLSPATAAVMSELILGKVPSVAIEPFGIDRQRQSSMLK